MWFSIILNIVLVIGIGFLLWILIRLTEQIEEFEETIEWFDEWKNELVSKLAEANSKMKAIDNRGTFSSDDEIGFAYETINECIEQGDSDILDLIAEQELEQMDISNENWMIEEINNTTTGALSKDTGPY